MTGPSTAMIAAAKRELVALIDLDSWRARGCEIEDHEIESMLRAALETQDGGVEALRAALRESLIYVEMASGADNSGEEYPLQCQSCGGAGANRHYHDCKLVAFARRVTEILAGA